MRAKKCSACLCLLPSLPSLRLKYLSTSALRITDFDRSAYIDSPCLTMTEPATTDPMTEATKLLAFRDWREIKLDDGTAQLASFANDQVHGLGVAVKLPGTLFTTGGHCESGCETYSNLGGTPLTTSIGNVANCKDASQGSVAVSSLFGDVNIVPNALSFYPPRPTQGSTGLQDHAKEACRGNMLKTDWDAIFAKGYVKAIRLTDPRSLGASKSYLPLIMTCFLSTSPDAVNEDGSDPFEGIRARWAASSSRARSSDFSVKSRRPNHNDEVHA